MRISVRVGFLRFKDWWAHKQIWRWLRSNLPRPLGVVMIFAVTLALVHWAGVPLDKLGERIKGVATGAEDSQIRGQTVLIVLSIPVAFALWVFRDINARADLDNKRKDVNLKEFQEIQMRAAGAMDEKLPASARESLQIAATHQLAGFLKGEYGESFQRPAWELLRARLLASSHRMGYPAIREWLDNWHKAEATDPMPASKLRNEIRGAVWEITMDSTGKAQRDVVRDEWRTIFGARLPLLDTVFDGINAPSKALLASRDLSRCSFIGAYLGSAHLEGADLGSAHLEGADLESAHLEGANLRHAHLEGANLWLAHLEGADLGSAHLEGANLRHAYLEGANLWLAHLEGAYLGPAHLEGAYLGFAHLEGADLMAAHLEGANLMHAHLEGSNLSGAEIDENTALTRSKCDNTTIFADDWDTLSEAKKDQARALWLERGMVNVDAPPDPPEDVQTPAT